VAVGNAFVEVGIVVTGSGDAVVVESGGLLVGTGAVAESGRLLVGVGADICGVGWAVVSWFVDGALVVSPCWLHPYSDNPTSIPAVVIWIFRNEFILRYLLLLSGIFRRSILIVSRGRGLVNPMSLVEITDP
jgi:hypothetical protein